MKFKFNQSKEMKNGLLTIELNHVHRDLFVGLYDGPVAGIGHDGRYDLDTARCAELVLPLPRRTIAGGACTLLLFQSPTLFLDIIDYMI